MHAFVTGIKYLMLGLLKGMLYVAAIAALLIVAFRLVSGGEAVPTYEAQLGEQDRSLDYDPPPQIIVEHTHEIVTEVGHLVRFQCDETNLYLIAMMEHIASNIAKAPELGYLYQDAILTIQEAWCHE